MTEAYRNPFDPENQTEGTKFGWDDRGVLIQAAVYTNNQGSYGDYCQLELTGLADGEDEPRVKYYPFGSGITASEDGEMLNLGEGKIRKDSKGAQFGAGLATIDAKLALKFAQKASTLVGYKFHFREIEQKDKAGAIKTREYVDKKGEKRKAPVTVPVPQSIVSAPKGSGADESTENDARTAIREVLSANNGALEAAKLNQALATHLNGIEPKKKTAILGLAADRKFLKSLPDSGIGYDGLRLSL